MITTKNYFSEIEKLNVSELPEALLKSHDLVMKVTKNGSTWDTYDGNATIKKVVDLYLSKLNEFAKKKVLVVTPGTAKRDEEEKKDTAPVPAPASLPPAAKPKKERKPKAGNKKEIKESKEKKSTAPTGSPIERIDDEHRIIKRFVALHGKEKTDDQIMAFIDTIQKAILERRVNKNSRFATEVAYIQSQLVKVYNALIRNKQRKTTIELTDKELSDYGKIAGEVSPMASIALLKRYVSMDGHRGMKQKAIKLLSQIDHAIEKGKIMPDDKYWAEIKEAKLDLENYINNRSKVPEVFKATLNGISALPQKKSPPEAPRNEKPSGIRFLVAKHTGTGNVKVQSVMFDRHIFSPDEAQKWLSAGEYLNTTDFEKPVKGEYYRFRQRDPKEFKQNTFRNIIPSKNEDGLGFWLPFISGGIAEMIKATVIEDYLAEKFVSAKDKLLAKKKDSSGSIGMSDTEEGKESNMQGKRDLSGMEVENDLPELPEKDSKQITGTKTLDQAMSQEFRPIGLYGGWKSLIGDACLPTSIFIYGRGGSGKSTCALMLGEFLATLNYYVLYVAGEQFGTPTFKRLISINNIQGNDYFHVTKDMNVDLTQFDFVFLDSKDSLDIKVEQFREMKKKYPTISWVLTSQGTKAGDFTGEGEWRNEVDTIIYCEAGTALTHDKNRWGGHNSIALFSPKD